MAPCERRSPDLSSLPELLADLRLHQRKAFELCATVLWALRQSEANPLEDPLKEALSTAHKIADFELRTQNDGVPVTTFLANGLATVVRNAKEAAEAFPLSEAGQQALDILTRLRTTLPGRAEPGCRIRQAFVDCYVAAEGFYSEYLTVTQQLPGISLRINYSDSQNEALPGRRIAFNGSVRYEDEVAADAKRSAVRLSVHPMLNSGCLPALPYILMHEILCHWPQMSRLAGARPNPRKIDNPGDRNALRFEIDPFSEGWMDGLVAKALRRQFGDADTARAEEARTAEVIHRERTLYNSNPAFADAARIWPGSEAARLVEWFYVVDDEDPELDPSTADPDFYRLSCELNVAAWSYEERREGCNALFRACRAYIHKRKHGKELNKRDASILAALRQFRKDREATQVLEALKSS